MKKPKLPMMSLKSIRTSTNKKSIMSGMSLRSTKSPTRTRKHLKGLVSPEDHHQARNRIMVIAHGTQVATETALVSSCVPTQKRLRLNVSKMHSKPVHDSLRKDFALLENMPKLPRPPMMQRKSGSTTSGTGEMQTASMIGDAMDGTIGMTGRAPAEADGAAAKAQAVPATLPAISRYGPSFETGQKSELPSGWLRSSMSNTAVQFCLSRAKDQVVSLEHHKCLSSVPIAVVSLELHNVLGGMSLLSAKPALSRSNDHKTYMGKKIGSGCNFQPASACPCSVLYCRHA